MYIESGLVQKGEVCSVEFIRHKFQSIFLVHMFPILDVIALARVSESLLF